MTTESISKMHVLLNEKGLIPGKACDWYDFASLLSFTFQSESTQLLRKEENWAGGIGGL